MLSKNDIRDCLHEGLSEVGFKRQRLTWWYTSEEVLWRIELEKLPKIKGYAIYVCFALICGEFAQFPSITDDFVQFYAPAEGLLPDEYEVRVMAMPEYDRISDGERHEGLIKIGHALGEYVSKHSSLDAILDAYQHDEFKRTLIRKEVRALLDKTLANRIEE